MQCEGRDSKWAETKEMPNPGWGIQGLLRIYVLRRGAHSRKSGSLCSPKKNTDFADLIERPNVSPSRLLQLGYKFQHTHTYTHRGSGEASAWKWGPGTAKTTGSCCCLFNLLSVSPLPGPSFFPSPRGISESESNKERGCPGRGVPGTSPLGLG